uniref:TolC family protein n=1 Tax=Proteiniborus sp. TaxID=2079015 RepID=UPI003323DC41
MKRLLSLVLVIVMIFSMSIVTYAENKDVENEVVNELDPDTEIELSLEQAIDYALEHSRDMRIQDLDMKRAELKYDQDRKTLRDYRNNKELIDAAANASREEKAFIDFDILTIVDQKEYFDLGILDRQAKLSKQISTWNKEIKENEIKYNVEKAYFDLSQSEKDLEIAKEGFELANRQYEQSKKMYELGTISHQQLLSVELAVSQAQSGFDMAEMGYELQKMSFNNTLGLSLGQKIKLTDKIEYKEHEEIKLEESMETARDNSAM